MKFNLGTAALLSFLFIVEIAAVSGIIAGSFGLVQIPVVDQRLTAIIVTGAAPVLAFFILYKSHA